MKPALQITGLAVALLTASAASRKTIIFDENLGGTAKSGTTEKASGVDVGSDVRGDPLSFDDFSVEAGISNENTNLAWDSFTRSQDIDESPDAYQDIDYNHGGIGTYSDEADQSNKQDSDNIQANLTTRSTGDEVLFFEFASDVFLEKAWFNGNHEENVAFTDNGEFDDGDTLFNIFYSEDGDTFTSVFGPSNGGNQRAPAKQEDLSTGLSDGYSHFAIAASGWGDAPGGYVEAIEYKSVPEPSSLALIGLGLVGFGFSSRRRKV